jgi:prepilin-type N-terminal cleavage/methylation domain-containing protein
MNAGIKARKPLQRGFTLIELLTVIAIIAILAGLLFPVFARAQEAKRQAECSSNLGELARGVKMYYDDWGVYPDALYKVSYNGGPFENRMGDVVRYVKSHRHFTCPNHPQQFKNSTAPVAPTNRMTNAPAVNGRTGAAMSYQALDSYDFQYHPNNPPGTPELHYNTRWLISGNAGADDRRQLYRKDPAPNTVLTWCLYHSSMSTTGQPATGHQAIVVFLNGTVKKIDAKKLVDWSTPGSLPWQVTP